MIHSSPTAVQEDEEPTPASKLNSFNFDLLYPFDRLLERWNYFNEGQYRCSCLSILDARPGVGGSTIALLLAAAAARRNGNTLLIDMDAEKGILAPRLATAIRPSTIVAGNWVDYIMPTHVQGLHLLTLSETARLSEEERREAMKEVRADYDLTLLDLSSERTFYPSLSLAAESDGVLLVVDSECSLRQTQEKIRALEERGATLWGTIFNRLGAS